MKESSGVRSKLLEQNKKDGSPYEGIPVETKLEDGFPDVLFVRKTDGKVSLVETKFIRPGDTTFGLRRVQVLFLRRWASLAPGSTRAWVLARVSDGCAVEEGLYLFKCRGDWSWSEDIELPLEKAVERLSPKLFSARSPKSWSLILTELYL